MKRLMCTSQSLIVPFAFLINNERDTVLLLLESFNDNGRSGLDILIQTWCENAETFQGFWPSRVSTLALSKLFASGRPSLQNLTVKGDLIVRQETRNSEYRYSLAYRYDTEGRSYHDTIKDEAE
jgi:hypothetical protein